MSRALVSSSVSAPNTDVRKVRLYRNGDANFTGKDLVFNRRQVKTIDRFLQTATELVDLPRAARSIHTPRNGTTVKSLDEINDRESYVVVGQGSKFRPLNYGLVTDARYGSRTRERKKQPGELEPIRIVEHSPIRVPGRMHQAVVDVVPIYVYCNGDDQEPPKRILLPDNLFRQQNARRSWEMILAEISRYVQPQFTATTQLYTLDGTPVKHRSEITPGKEFVAVGYKAPFRHMNYVLAGTKPAFNVSPRIIRRNLTNGSEQFYRPHRQGRANYSSDEESMSYVDSSSQPPMSTQSDPVIQKNRPYRYDYKVVYTDGRNVFPNKTTGRPIKYQEPLPAIADDRDDGGVFKARTARVETSGAKEVDDQGSKSDRRYADKKTRTSRTEAEGAKEPDEQAAYGRPRRYADNRRYPQNNDMRSPRMDAEADDDYKPARDKHRANPKPKASRVEADDDVNENKQPTYATRASVSVRNSRMETEEMGEGNDDEPMSDAERHVNGNTSHRDDDYYDAKPIHGDPDGRANRRRTSRDAQSRQQQQDHHHSPQRQQSKRSKVSNGGVTPRRRSDAGRQIVRCGATVEVHCSHEDENHRHMEYGSEADDDEEGRRRNRVPVPVATETDGYQPPKTTHFIFIADDDEEGDYDRRESSKVDEDREPAADDKSTDERGVTGEQSVETVGQVTEVERRESSKAGESYREHEGQNAVEETEDKVEQQEDADEGDQPEERVEQEPEPEVRPDVTEDEVKDDEHPPEVQDDSNTQDDRDPQDDSKPQDDSAERGAATKIQAAFKGYSTRKRLRAERSQNDPPEAATADATVKEETAAEALADN